MPIYFLMLDRFNNAVTAPKGDWNRRFDFRHGGTFKGVQAQLGYLAALGVARGSFRVESRGATVPVSIKKTPAARAMNRRVELVFAGPQ